VKVRPVPHIGIPFQPRLEHHTTEVVPFSFDERDKEMFVRKEEKIKTVLEEEKKVLYLPFYMSFLNSIFFVDEHFASAV